jgi:RNA polymerase sigma-70 factor (subfamily 1)
MRRAEQPSDALLQRAATGDLAAGLELLFAQRPRLRELVRSRMLPELARHLEPSDIVQESLTAAARRLPEFAEKQPLPFYVWLRRLTLDRLGKANRRYLRTQARDARREVKLELNDASVDILAQNLVSKLPSPPRAAIVKERAAAVRAALLALPNPYRDVIELRYVEQLSVRESAAALGLTESNVKIIHFRALKRLRDTLADSEGSAS